MSAEPVHRARPTVRPGRWAPDLSDPVRELSDRVLEQLGDHLADADRHAAAYVRDYAAAVITGRGARPTPGNLHPAIGALIRDLTRDEALPPR